ncbi:spectrin beta chain-like isoform X4 [Homarus americanus]|uniref:spectrin beta chain-like isoform X4 n=1 Tax=Homarus americanus TaxID=6706 RepID=UPI001C484059|nr:spectrin beta chain-like isoform X4 [Homarus americanus]
MHTAEEMFIYIILWSAVEPPSAVPPSKGQPHTLPRAPTPASKESRRRVRSRSKSPFRSFRWKKSKSSPSEAPGSASDDESNLERAAERPSPSGDEDQLEGSLVRKHEWESTTKKASNRSWDKVFLVLRANMLLFYKDRKSYQAAPEVYFRAEAPCDVSGGQASIADDYTKKKNVLRLKTKKRGLLGGAEYLFQAKDEEELGVWVGALQAATTSEGSAGPSRSQTLPAGSEKKDEPKRRSFFTLKKK